MNRIETIQDRLLQFNTQFATLMRYPQAVSYLLNSIPSWFSSPKAILLVTKEPEQWPSLEKVHGFRPATKSVILSKNDPLAALLHSNKLVVALPSGHEKTHITFSSEFIKSIDPSFKLNFIIKLRVLGMLWGALLLESPVAAHPQRKKLDQLLTQTGEIVGVTLRHARLLYTFRRAALEKDLLLDISRSINSTLQLDQLLENVLDSLRQVVPYDKGSVFVLDPRTKSIARAARRGPAPLIDEVNFVKKSEGLCTWVLNNGRPVVVHDVSKDRRYFPMYLDTQSELDVPIVHREKVLGIINLESNRKGAFGKNDRMLVQAFSGQAAVAIENAWLYKELLDKRELEKELKIAKQLQRALLPRRWPKIGDYDFSALNIPSRAVGGDLYDFVQLSADRIGITIGDVAGKGTPGAILMATLYSTYRGLVRLPMPLHHMMSELNNILRSRIASYSFITFFYGVINTESEELTYCNAGHCPPLLVHADGSYEELHNGGTVLGFVQDTPYELGLVKLRQSDLLFLYTDGITEAQSPQEEFFGEERLIHALRDMRDNSAGVILRKIFRSVKMFTGGVRPQDDFTAMAIKVGSKTSLVSY
jgi:phosphoserine phosphatase RsbU/P